MKWIFWLSAIFIAYTYAGYLGWLWLRAKLRPWPVRRGTAEPTVSVVMVVHNEGQVLEQKLRNLFELDYPAERCQLVVVSDGSSDRTEEILREHDSHPRLYAVMNQLSRGKAAGLNSGIEVAQGEIVVFTDARQRIEAGALRLLMQNFADPEVGCVSGELMLGDGTGESGQGMGLYWRVEKKVREMESASDSVVGATGALYAVRRELLTEIPEGTILDDVYLPMEVARQGRRVVFDARARAWDHPNLGGDREFTRKVRTLSGNYQLLQLAPWLLSGNNRIRFEFISHKLLRLAVPLALVIALVSCVFISGIFYRVCLILQVVFYALSLLAILDFKLSFFHRVSDAALTFVLLNGAAVVAFANFVTGKKVAWTR
jgi:cellulose synthase/poly-beta-1,6-N-acetylglucosamine synthase-like glycosyltransferase